MGRTQKSLPLLRSFHKKSWKKSGGSSYAEFSWTDGKGRDLMGLQKKSSKRKGKKKRVAIWGAVTT